MYSRIDHSDLKLMTMHKLRNSDLEYDINDLQLYYELYVFIVTTIIMCVVAVE